MASSHQFVFQELQKLTVRELNSSKALLPLLRSKLALLDTSKFDQRECIPYVDLFCDVMKEVLEDRYQDLSLRAFIHLAAALDYFVDPHEDVPDGVQTGLLDDLTMLRDTEQRFRYELQKFKEWRQRQPK